MKQVALIFNPNAGKKRKLWSFSKSITASDIEQLLQKQQIQAKVYVTKSPASVKNIIGKILADNINTILIAGGDGTVAEVLQEVINKKVTLGILPMGSFMNIARMLNIPLDIKKAIAVMAKGNKQAIDVAAITYLSGKKLQKPCYFIEEAGIGLEADLHYHLTRIFEKKQYLSFFKIFFSVRDFKQQSVTLISQNETIQEEATLVTVANAPITWGAIRLTPKAKLNDHKLTVSLYSMKHRELVHYFWYVFYKGRAPLSTKVKQIQAKEITLTTIPASTVHADARIFGETPITFSLVPDAVSFFVGEHIKLAFTPKR